MNEESGEWKVDCRPERSRRTGGVIKKSRTCSVSGLGFLSVPSQAVAGLQVAHVAAAARAVTVSLEVCCMGAIIQGMSLFGEGRFQGCASKGCQFGLQSLPILLESQEMPWRRFRLRA